MESKKTAIILNVSAGSGGSETLHSQIEKACREHGLEGKIFLVHTGTDIRQLARKLSAEYGIIVAAGGDGTVSAIAGELAGTSSVLGILPLGTRNHFAKDVRISADLEEAVAILSKGEVMAVDTASVNGRFFINNASIGLYPKIVRRRDSFQQKGFPRWVAYVIAFFLAVGKRSFLGLRIISRGKDMTGRTALFFAGNNEYAMRGYELGSRASLVRGKLFLYMMKHDTRSELFRIAVQIILNLPPKYADFDIWESWEATVYSGEKFLQVAIDGETMPLETPLHYLAHPRSLRVIVPQEYAQNNPHF